VRDRGNSSDIKENGNYEKERVRGIEIKEKRKIPV
jgi:hypothetical protein